MSDERRVRTLRLSAREEDLIRRAAILAQDALRTASLPGGDGRLWLVRSLDLGTIRADAGPAALARRLESRMAMLPAAAVHAESPGAAAAPAVFFADDAQPFVALARHLARGGTAGAWFWPLAVPGWCRGQPPETAWRSVLDGALATAAGPAAAATVVRELLELGALAPLAAALRPGDGSRLLRAWGGLGGAPVPAPRSAARWLPRDWRRQAAPWIARWGVKAERSLWLAAALLIAARPGRLTDPRLAARAARLRAELGAASVAHFEKAGETGATSSTTNKPAAGQEPEFRPPGTGGPHPGTASSEPAPDRSPPLEESEPPPGSAVSEAPAAGAEAPKEEPEPAIPPPIPPSISPRGQSTAHPRPTEAEARDRLPGVPAGREAARPAASAGRETPSSAHGEPVPGGDWVEMPAPADSPWDGEPRPTEWAGLVFLLPILSRLGIESFLAEHPHLVEAELPLRLLHHLARRLEIPQDDPARAAFPLSDESDDPKTHVEAATVVLEAWLVAARRWCRRSIHLGLHDLAHRGGRIASTRTHLDVLFDLGQVDLRLRRTGVDVDPGWLPWLGRVVRFHYLEEPHSLAGERGLEGEGGGV